jgi:hypothetical protein
MYSYTSQIAMTSVKLEQVWYVAYGSNLYKRRFLRYLDPQKCDAGTMVHARIRVTLEKILADSSTTDLCG